MALPPYERGIVFAPDRVGSGSGGAEGQKPDELGSDSSSILFSDEATFDDRFLDDVTPALEQLAQQLGFSTLDKTEQQPSDCTRRESPDSF
jgi:hypothetical protein